MPPAPSARRRRPSLVVLLLVPSAIAVAVVLLLLRLYFQPPTVPPYVLATVSPVGAERVFARGARFEVDLRPTGPVVGAVAARAFLLRGDEIRPWDPPFEVARDGSVHIAGSVDTLFGGVPAGAWEIVFAVGRPETLPTAPKDVLHARDAPPDASAAPWQLVRERIRLGE